jgi:chemotaxis protein MotB
MNGNLVVPADFKSVVPVRKAREVGSIPTRPRSSLSTSEDTMKAVVVLVLILAVLLGVATWYYYRSASSAQTERDELMNAREELLARFSNLEREKAELSNRLDMQIANLSKEKQQELDRLRATYDTLVTDLKSEIDQGQITITKMADRLSVSMVDKILFSSGEADITAEGIKVLNRIGNVLKNTENKVVRVEGHTDNVPISSRLAEKFPSNWELSTTRATNVVRFLQDRVGIPPGRLEAVGLSEYHPVSTNKTLAGRSQNRRIEIALLPDIRELPRADR